MSHLVLVNSYFCTICPGLGVTKVTVPALGSMGCTDMRAQQRHGRCPHAGRVRRPYRGARAACWQARGRERVLKGGIAASSPAEKREYIRHWRPRGLSVAEGCRLMELARSTYHDGPKSQPIAPGGWSIWRPEPCPLQGCTPFLGECRNRPGTAYTQRYMEPTRHSRLDFQARETTVRVFGACLRAQSRDK